MTPRQPGGMLEELAAAHRRVRTAQDELRTAVERARESGYTWQEIGDVLGTTRQAAFHRFGRLPDPHTGLPVAESAVPGATARAVERAVELVANLAEGRIDEACRDFDETMRRVLDATKLAAGWAQLIGLVGRYEGMREPSAHPVGDYTLVHIPLRFEAGERTAQVTYDRDGRVAGLYLLGPGVI